MPSYKLYYFNLRGRAELARLIFAYAGVEYEDVRFDRNTEWPTIYKNKMPFGQCPFWKLMERCWLNPTPLAVTWQGSLG